MPLTDPELDLLREMLEEDPADDAFLQVGEELVRRSRWAEAEDTLTRGLAHHPGAVRGFELLARAALECGRYDLALSAIGKVDRDRSKAPENARLEILALERAGRVGEARTLAEGFLAEDPGDVVVQAVLERLDAPPPANDQRAIDPFYTVARAERYVAIGRPDRAIRAYRRILLANPGSDGLQLRVRQLAARPAEGADDLSEELTDPVDVPEAPSELPEEKPTDTGAPMRIDMPSPTLSQYPSPDRVVGPGMFGGEVETDPDEEDTDLDAKRPAEGADEEQARRQRRRRRSLIRR